MGAARLIAISTAYDLSDSKMPRRDDRHYINRPILGRLAAVVFWLNPPFQFLAGASITAAIGYFVYTHLLNW